MTLRLENLLAIWSPREVPLEAHTEAGNPAMAEAVLVGGKGMSLVFLGISLCNAEECQETPTATTSSWRRHGMTDRPGWIMS